MKKDYYEERDISIFEAAKRAGTGSYYPAAPKAGADMSNYSSYESSVAPPLAGTGIFGF